MPVDPCGVALTEFRACYKSRMRFPGGIIIPGAWYFTDEEFLPFYSAYADWRFAREDASDEDYDDGWIGEIRTDPWQFTDGTGPFLDCAGFRGSPDAWAGLPTDELYVVQGFPLPGVGGLSLNSAGRLVQAGAGALGLDGAGGLIVAGGGTLGLDGAGALVHPGGGGLALDGEGRLVLAGGGTLGLDGEGGLIVAGGGGLALDGEGRLVLAGGGTLGLDGEGGLIVAGGGGLALDGAGRLVLAGGGTLGLDGEGGLIVAGGGGLALDGAGRRIVAGGGGLALDGAGRRIVAGGGGLALDGAGRLVMVASGSGGLALDGAGQVVMVGSGGGGLALDGAGLGDASVPGTWLKWDFETFVMGVIGATGQSWIPASGFGGTIVLKPGIAGTYYIAELSTGSGSASGFVGMLQNDSAVGLAGKPTTGTKWTLEFRLYIPTLSVGAQRFKVQAGWLDVVNGTPAEGIWFEYQDNVNSGQWVLNTKKTLGGAATGSANTTTAPVANTITTLKIVCTGTSIEWFIDGVSVGTLSSALPTAGVAAGFCIVKSVGTSALLLSVDSVILQTEY